MSRSLAAFARSSSDTVITICSLFFAVFFFLPKAFLGVPGKVCWSRWMLTAALHPGHVTVWSSPRLSVRTHHWLISSHSCLESIYKWLVNRRKHLGIACSIWDLRTPDCITCLSIINKRGSWMDIDATTWSPSHALCSAPHVHDLSWKTRLNGIPQNHGTETWVYRIEPQYFPRVFCFHGRVQCGPAVLMVLDPPSESISLPPKLMLWLFSQVSLIIHWAENVYPPRNSHPKTTYSQQPRWNCYFIPISTSLRFSYTKFFHISHFCIKIQIISPQTVSIWQSWTCLHTRKTWLRVSSTKTQWSSINTLYLPALCWLPSSFAFFVLRRVTLVITSKLIGWGFGHLLNPPFLYGFGSTTGLSR